MKISELINQGYLEDTKEGYVIKKNFSLLDLSSTLDKSLIIPENSGWDLRHEEFDLANRDRYKLQEFVYTGKGYLFVSERKDK